MRTIDLNRRRSPGSKVFSGRGRGAAVRQAEALDALDTNPEEVVRVRVPDDIYSLNVSFFLALFGRSVLTLGSKEAFLRKYQFEAPPHIAKAIDTGVDYALKQSNALADWS